jgi:hypothetical protein
LYSIECDNERHLQQVHLTDGAHSCCRRVVLVVDADAATAAAVSPQSHEVLQVVFLGIGVHTVAALGRRNNATDAAHASDARRQPRRSGRYRTTPHSHRTATLQTHTRMPTHTPTLTHS